MDPRVAVALFASAEAFMGTDAHCIEPEGACDMSALLHLFKLLPDRDRLAAACVCKVSIQSTIKVCMFIVCVLPADGYDVHHSRNGMGSRSILPCGPSWTYKTISMQAKHYRSCLISMQVLSR